MTAIAMPSGFGYSFAPARSQGISGEAEHLEDLLFELRDNRYHSVFLGWRNTLAAEVWEVFKDCSTRGWDGYDAEPITIDTALQCIRMMDLLPDGQFDPEIVPEPDGYIGLEWQNDIGMTMVMSVATSEITFAAILGDKRRSTGVRPISDEIPNEILDMLARYFSMDRSPARSNI